MKFLLFLLVIILSCSDQSVYDVVLQNEKGEPVKLSSLGKEGMVLYLWTGTCIGHTRDLKKLSTLYQKGILTKRVISVALFMESEEAIAIKEKNHISKLLPFYADPKGNLADFIKITFLPSTVFIDEKGKVIGNYPGLAEHLLAPVSSHN